MKIERTYVYLGNSVVLSATLTDAYGDRVDDPDLRCFVYPPDGADEEERTVSPGPNGPEAVYLPEAVGRYVVCFRTPEDAVVQATGWHELIAADPRASGSLPPTA